ncbi:MAG: DUF58 domain-containing protein [Planctomycetota bacterium]
MLRGVSSGSARLAAPGCVVADVIDESTCGIAGKMSLSESKPPPSPQSKRSWFDWLLWIATEDHCAWANRYVYWIKTPLGILLSCAFFALLCGLFMAPQAFVLVGVIAAVIGVGMAWPGIAMKGLRCRLVFTSRRGREGQPARAKLIVTNRWPWPVWGLAIDDSAFGGASRVFGEQSESAMALARVDGWSRSTYYWTPTPQLRGMYPRCEIRMFTGFPFGLRRASRPVEVSRALTVWPSTFWLPPLEDHLRRRDWSGTSSDALVGTDGTRLGVRDYRHGDNLRDVHWAKSARHERLMVSEREAPVVADCKVIVDVDPRRQAGSGGDSTLEWSLRIAASVCESVIGQRGRVELWFGGERIGAGSGADSLECLLDGVARFDAAAQPARRDCSPPPRSVSQYVVSIGTDVSPSLSERSIVLRRRAFDERNPDQENRQDSWIYVDASTDVPGQVLQGWRSRTRRLRLVR